MMFKQLGENIKLLRTSKKLSQTDLGNELNLSRQQIATYEKGEKTIPLVNVIEISKLFNIQIDFLVNMNLNKLTNKEFKDLLAGKFKGSHSFINELSTHHTEKDSSVSLLNNYVKNVVKEELSPFKNLLEKVLVRIELTDLKYELSEEIKLANESFLDKEKENN